MIEDGVLVESMKKGKRSCKKMSKGKMHVFYG
jgi:hypothetical protein